MTSPLANREADHDMTRICIQSRTASEDYLGIVMFQGTSGGFSICFVSIVASSWPEFFSHVRFSTCRPR